MAEDQPLKIVVTRYFHADAQRVYDAFIDPATMGQWLFATPDGQMVRVECEPRVGGKFLIVEKRGEELAEHFGEYLTLDPPSKIVFTFGEPADENPSIVSVEIKSLSNGCEVTLTHLMSPRWADYTDNAIQGWTMILNSLGSKVLDDHQLVINRTFAAPASLVYDAWIDPQHLMHWHCPEKFSVVSVTSHSVPQGKWRCTMKDPQGELYISIGQFLKLQPHTQIDMTHGWEDNHTEDCHQGHMSFITIHLSEQGNQTTMRFIQSGLASAASRDSHQGGWGGAFENLNSYLSQSVK